MPEQARVVVWGENIHEQRHQQVRELYPDGMHTVIAEGIRERLGDRVDVRTATFVQEQHGLPPEVLDETDVLTWWGHLAHEDVEDEVVERVYRRVLAGMGLVVLHSGHLSKIFRRLMGTSCTLRWRSGEDRELVWTVNPAHPVAAGVPHPIVIERQEMYGEFFDIPAPDELVFLSTFSGGEVFRSGCAYRRGNGKVFYFSPGDQAFPVFHHPDIRQVIANAVWWARPEQALAPPALRQCDTGWFEEGTTSTAAVMPATATKPGIWHR